MKKKLAVYAGTFDPPTLGHLWMIKEGSKIFDTLIVAIGVNPEKKCMFTPEERLEMLRDMTQSFKNIRIEHFVNQFLINYAKSIGAHFILRGIRNATDYEYESAMRNLNASLAPEITTVFLKPDSNVAEISSSMVKGLIGPEEWEKIADRYVSPFVFEKLKEKYYGKK